MFFNPEVFGNALYEEYSQFPPRRFSRVIGPMESTIHNHRLPSIVKPNAVPMVINKDEEIEKISNGIREEYDENLVKQYDMKYQNMELEELQKLKGEKEEIYRIMENSATFGVVSSKVHEEAYALKLELKVINKQIELLMGGDYKSAKVGNDTETEIMDTENGTEDGGWISTKTGSKSSVKITEKNDHAEKKSEDDIMDFLNDNDYTPPNHQPSLSDMEEEIEEEENMIEETEERNGIEREEDEKSGKDIDSVSKEFTMPEYFNADLVESYVIYCLKRKWSVKFQKIVEEIPEEFTADTICKWREEEMYERYDAVRSLILMAKMEAAIDELVDQVGQILRLVSVKLTYLEEIFGILRLAETYAIEWSKGSISERNKRSVITGLDMEEEDIVALTLKSSSVSGNKPLNYIFERDFVPLINAYYRVSHFSSLVTSLFEIWSDKKKEQRTIKAFETFAHAERDKITELLNKMCFIIQDMTEKITGKKMENWSDGV